MKEKNTKELNEVLGKTHLSDFEKYCAENKESVSDNSEAFSIYVKNLLQEKKLTQQYVFLQADIPERYGYAAKFSLAETQRALKIYEMPELYAKVPRDALLMIAFNERPGSILDVNDLLNQKGLQPLRTSGVQD